MLSLGSLYIAIGDRIAGLPPRAIAEGYASPGPGGEFPREAVPLGTREVAAVVELDLFNKVGTKPSPAFIISPPTSSITNRLESTLSNSSISKLGFARYVTENVNVPGGSCTGGNSCVDVGMGGRCGDRCWLNSSVRDDDS